MIKHKILILFIVLAQNTYAQSKTDTVNIESLQIGELNERYGLKLVFLNEKLFTGFFKQNDGFQNIHTKVELGEIKESHTYDENFSLIKNEVFRYGGLSEETNFHTNGEIHSKGIKFQNLKHGIWKFYDSQGKFNVRVNYYKGEEIPLNELYDVNGRILPKFSFDDRIKYKGYKKLKNDTVMFRNLNREFEGCSKVDDKAFSLEERTLKDSLEFCNQKLFKRKKSYSGYMYKNKKDTLYFVFNGQIKFMKIFEDGDLFKYASLDRQGNMQGIFYEFYSTGRIKTKGYYNKNKMDGYFYDYYDNGGLKNRFYGYLNDSKAGHWFFYYMPDGKETKIEVYESGKIHSVAYVFYDDEQNKHTYFFGPTGELNIRFIEDKYGTTFESEKFMENKFIDTDVQIED